MAKAKAGGKRTNWDGKLYYLWDPMPDSTRRTGRHRAVINMVEDENGHGVSLRKPGRPEKLPGQAVAEILVEGPLYDVTTAGTDIIVSEAVHAFLAKRVGSHCRFLPVDLIDKNGKPAGKRYYGIQFRRSVAAMPAFMEYDLQQISESGFPLFVAYCKGEPCMNATFITADLAEEMVAAAFTGLGFSNLFDDRKPGSVSVQLAELEKLPKTKAEIRLDRLREIALAAQSPTEGWAQLLALLGKEKRSKKWTELSGADVESDAKAAGKWLRQLFKSEPPDQTIKAFWVGLFEEWQGEYAIPKLYIRGSATYTDDSAYDNEWAVDATWRGSDQSFDSAVMHQLGRFAEDHESLTDTVMYTAVLGYATLLMHFALNALPKQSLHRLGKGKRPVAIGFDSGDFLFLGDISKDGLAGRR